MAKGKRMLALLLAGAMTAGTLSGCSSSAESTQTEQTQMVEEIDKKPLVIAVSGITQNFNAFYASSQGDRSVTDMTSAYLLGKDRSGEYILNGIEGETKPYNGTDYTYTGIADCKVKTAGSGATSYTFRLRDGVKFSDGTQMTADDLIFSLYVYLDPAYDGPIEMDTLPIKGLQAYSGNSEKLCRLMLSKGESNTDFTDYSKKKQKKFFKEYWPEAKKQFLNSILGYCETKSVAKAMIALGYASKNTDTGVVTATYSLKRWTMKDDDKPSMTNFWDELKLNSAFGNDIETMSDSLVADGVASQGVFEYLPEAYRRTIDTGEKKVNYISGIKRVDDSTVKITLTERNSTALQKFAVPVQPLHYYGDVEKYNYKKHRFGFDKGDLSAIKKLKDNPIGAGPYTYVGYSGDVVYLEANRNYWKKIPDTPVVQMVSMSESDMAYSLVEGAADIAEPSISKDDLGQIRKVNSNGSENGDVITTTFTDYDAFGYIGFNVQRVRVGANALTKESVYLRRAIAVVLAFYRFSSVHDYYGDTAKLIDYAFSDDSWVVFKEWESSYEKAYNRDINGKLIYTTDMTYAERKAAVLDAALGYFKAAGYKVGKGKVKEAPEGASMGYEVMITGYGSGDHPSYAMVKNAAKALKSIGFKLEVTDVDDSNDMFSACQGGNADMWVAAWPVEDDLDSYIYSLYHSKGGSAYMYNLYSQDMDDAIAEIMSSDDRDKRFELYRKCLEYLSYYTVEIPTYQRQNCILYSSQRVELESIPADQTSSYTWKDEIENIRMR